MNYARFFTGCFTTPIDLMFVVDGSKSVGDKNFEKIKEWLKKVTQSFDIEEKVHVGVVSLCKNASSGPWSCLRLDETPICYANIKKKR